MSADRIRVWVDGQRVDEGPAIAALDHGVTVGDGVFETAKIIDGQVFARTRHHDRMDRSLAGLGLGTLDRERVDEGIEAVLQDEMIEFGRLRYTITGGVGPLGSDRLDSPMTYIVTAGDQPRPTPATTVGVVPWIRNERAATVGLKTTSYAENVVALAAAKKLGGTEAIFANGAGDLCEGTGSNIFVVRDGVIFTPPLESGPLAGITRALTIEWCREEGLEVREEALPLSVLGEVDEAFLTSSTRDVQAIAAVRVVGAQQTLAGELPAADLSDRHLGDLPGPVTARAAEIFARLGRERLDP
ncbi:aminotransferase class IV [Ornithinimicrobium cryptoxanthini]|uniref:Aminotransferase class IV n=1 Tax=Ornithinimicrobium cryptoxanthini TaxID=2934161 RepID=A0ABY4YMR2_9MICO|nr:aminotransferase class IV [Ornithinimicrobium cryptoxanthini]USQ77775.1 aminotransferase class IV [Ornithinimicrobium cryptoxanthini]